MPELAASAQRWQASVPVHWRHWERSPGAVVAVRKPRPAQGQRQAQVVLGSVEPVQQPGVPNSRHPRRLLRVGLADTTGIAAELPAAFAHAPPGPLAVVQMLSS